MFALLVQRAMSETTVRHKSQGKTDASAAREKLLKVPVRLQCLAHLLLPRHWRSVPRSKAPVVSNVVDFCVVAVLSSTAFAPNWHWSRECLRVKLCAAIAFSGDFARMDEE